MMVRALAVLIGAVVWSWVGPAAAQSDLAPERAAESVEVDGGVAAGFSVEEREAIATRRDLATVHRWLGIGTWVTMTAATVLGYIQYRDEYGVFDDAGETPCARGTAVVPDACEGLPWPHAALVFGTIALYAGTFTLSILMPRVPEEAQSPNLTLHKALRWVHLGGVLGLSVLGFLVSNVVDDFGVRQALATWHLIGGTLTWASLTLSGAIMLF